MLRRFLKRRPTNGFLIAICCALAIALVNVTLFPPLNERPAVQTKNEAEKSVQANNTADHAGASVDKTGNPEDTNRSEEASEYWSIFGRRLKITDSLLVLFGFTLWIATQNLVSGTDDTAQRQLRAYLSIEPGRNGRQRRRIVFEFRPVITNNGLTPANNVRILSRIDVVPPNIPIDFDYTMDAPTAQMVGGLASVTTIGPRQNRFHARVARRLSIAEMREIVRGTKVFHLWGSVHYEDVFGEGWHSNFSYLIFVGATKRIETVWHNTEAHNEAT